MTRTPLDRCRRVALAALCVAACNTSTVSDPGRAPGEPLAGLSAAELGRFRAGQALFDRVFQPAEGLGPAFNENQCSACHTDPASGGTGEQRVVKATRFDGGTCDQLALAGGLNVRTQVTPALRARGVERESPPAAATARGRFTPPFLFGLGLVEAVPDDAILARHDPDDADGDGISGRAARLADGRLGRFGRKAEFPTLVEFAAGALRLEMGLTTPLDPTEPPVNGAPVPAGVDPVPDPEMSRETLDLLTDYVRFLAPLARWSPEAVVVADSIARGRRLFARAGCPSCHVPTLTTGSNAVRLYSDLLLHDMGRGLADVCAATAAPSELRTEMLMGLRYRKVFLHDGRAPTVRDAILLHGGEALPAMEAFTRLSLREQIYLLRFLDSL